MAFGVEEAEFSGVEGLAFEQVGEGAGLAVDGIAKQGGARFREVHSDLMGLSRLQGTGHQAKAIGKTFQHFKMSDRLCLCLFLACITKFPFGDVASGVSCREGALVGEFADPGDGEVATVDGVFGELVGEGETSPFGFAGHHHTAGIEIQSMHK